MKATLVLLGMSLGSVSVQDDPKKPGPTKTDYTEFSRLIHKMVVPLLPKGGIRDESMWGQTVEISPKEKLPLPKLRTIIKKGDKLEAPHGLWRKVDIKMRDPAKDLHIAVTDMKPVDATTLRLTMEADASLQTWTEAQHWQKGLPLLGFIAEADAKLHLDLECDVAITSKTFLDVKVEPKVASLKMDLREFTLRKVTLRQVGISLEGDKAKEIGNQFKGILSEALKTQEPRIKEMANDAIAQALREGKGTFSAVELFKVLGTTPKEKKKS